MIDLGEFQKMRESEHLIVFDANILLELYRKPSNISLDIIEAFKKIIDKIYIPRQVYDEYLRNYQKVCGDEKRKYQKVGTELSESLMKLQKDIASKTTEYRKHDYTDITKLQGDLEEKIEEIRNILKDYEDNHRNEIEKNKDFLRYDKVKEFIDLLVEHGNIGMPFPFSKKILIIQEGQVRFDNMIPPGYEDNTKEGINKYGDLFVWKNIIEIANEQNVNILFICNDIKEDWWEKNKGLPIEIRQELLEEFKENNPSLNIHFLTLEKFFSYIAEELKVGQSKSALQLSAMEYVGKNLDQYEDIIENEIGNYVAAINIDERLGGEFLSETGDEETYWSVKDVSVDKQDKDIFYYIDLDISILGDSIGVEDEEGSYNIGKIAVALDGRVKLITEEYSKVNRISDIDMELAEVFYIKPEVWKVIKKAKGNASCREMIDASKRLIRYQENEMIFSGNLATVNELGAVMQKYAELYKSALEPLSNHNYTAIAEAFKPLAETRNMFNAMNTVKIAEALEPIVKASEIVKGVDTVKLAEALKPLTSVSRSMSKLDLRGTTEILKPETNIDITKKRTDECGEEG